MDGIAGQRSYRDLQEHIAELEKRDLLHVIDHPVNKDTEMSALVRWQFRGGLREEDRKAFLFTNVTDSQGRKYDIPVVIGALAANQDIYATGMDAAVEEIAAKWQAAISKPIAPKLLNEAPCQDVVIEGNDLLKEDGGLVRLPIPLSTPGFDSSPTLAATNVITRNPDTGTQNMGTYRAGLKSSNRLVVRMATRVGGAEGYMHWQTHKSRGEKLPCAIVVGCPPYVAFMGPQKLPVGVEELHVAGGLAGQAINVVRARTVDLVVPAEAELVIEGLVDTEMLEPEGPFGESHGHVALEELNLPMHVTAITHRKKAVIPSYISQVAPSESSVIKRVAYEPLFLAHLRDHLGIKGIRKVQLHEPLTGLLRVTIISVDPETPRTEVWRALYGAASFKGDCGKITIAVNEDIDADNADAVLWAMAYRLNPAEDVEVLPHRGQGHGPKRETYGEEDSTLLIDATMKAPMPPLALPTKPYMEAGKELWEKLGLPTLRPESPWHGYSLGDWSKSWTEAAERATAGDWPENGRRTLQRQVPADVKPETSVREVEDGWKDELEWKK